MQWKTILAVGFGGGAGTYIRYELQQMVSTDSWINSTLIANSVGSFFIGFLSGWFYMRADKEWLRIGLGVGFCGGFTTMSTFAADTVQLALYGKGMILYILVSVLAGLMTCGYGLFIGTCLGKRRKSQ